MSHAYTVDPTKRAVGIYELKYLKDGLIIDWNNHFNLKTVDYPPTQEKLNTAVKQHCKFIMCRDIIHGNHKIFGEESYYTNLGITGDISSDFKLFQEYAKKSIEVNVGIAFIEKIENEFKALCNANNVTGDLGSVFE
tara:strand:+ start:5126 stop:5536 length:411 start_codon:yes stop_codon:yes gene_type:complete